MWPSNVYLYCTHRPSTWAQGGARLILCERKAIAFRLAIRINITGVVFSLGVGRGNIYKRYAPTWAGWLPMLEIRGWNFAPLSAAEYRDQFSLPPMFFSRPRIDRWNFSRA